MKTPRSSSSGPTSPRGPSTRSPERTSSASWCDDKASKTQIASAIEALYEVKVRAVNTMRSVGGKKAFVRLVPEDSATDLATKLGLV